MSAPTSTGTSRTVTIATGMSITIDEYGAGTEGTCVLMLHGGAGRGRGEDQVLDIRGVAPAEISKLSFADAAFRPDFSSFSDQQRAVMAANQKVLATYGGADFTFDPKLRRRLHRITVPVLVAWGEQDGIAPVGYGRAYAAAFPDGQFGPSPVPGTSRRSSRSAARWAPSASSSTPS
jgi:hypothetical protein